MRNLVSALIAWLLLSLAALADAPIISAPEAQAKLERGEIILLDIRSKKEWRETGVAKGAWPVSMHESDFAKRINAILAEYPPEQIAVMCAVGGRSKHITTLLKRKGITGVIDMSEGMMGNKRGPGWIARGLPIVSLEEAKRLSAERDRRND